MLKLLQLIYKTTQEDDFMNSFKRLLLTVISALTICLVAGPSVAQNPLDSTLKPYLSKYDLPALGAAVVKNGKIIAAGVVGTRRADANIPLTINDRFPLGSNTKAMTALLSAMMVDEGKLRWNSTVAEVFPELTDKMDSRLKTVTLEQLLSHTSGLPGDNEALTKIYMNGMMQGGNPDDMRYSLVVELVQKPLAAAPGAKFEYANIGYSLAGAMVERVGGKTWEELMVDRIFIPLKLATAGLGTQSSLGKTDAPLGHAVINGKLKPMLAGPNSDIPVVVSPAGSAHMSMLDFARWAGWNAADGKRGPALLKPQTMKKYHSMIVSMPAPKNPVPGTPPGGSYGLGWGQIQHDWAPYPLLYHGGSNTMNLSHIWVDVKQDLAIVITTNRGDKNAEEALRSLAKELYGRYKAK